MNIRTNTMVAAAVSAILWQSAALAGATPSEAADSPTPEADAGLENLAEVLITTASRAAASTVEKSSSPIDVVSSAELERTGRENLRDALADIYPAYSNIAGYQGQQGEGVKVATLHGLDPKDTLVLVNGKRRHKTALYVAGGQTPTDLDLIPPSAVDHLEILKDGAAAQYGSDAVAGVINIILKKNADGGSAEASYGQYGSKVGNFDDLQGQQGLGQLNQGFQLGNGGFLNLSAAVDVHKGTNVYGPYATRTPIYYPLADGSADPRETSVSRFRQIEGQPAGQNYTAGFNLEVPLADDVSAYAFGTYAHRFGQGWGFFRTARSPQNFVEVYPNGYMPKFIDVENDFQPVVGVKGNDLLGWRWDLSTSYGGDYAKVYTENSINASLGPDFGSKHNFYDGREISGDWVTDLDLTRKWNTGLFAEPLIVSIGGEFRRETFSVSPGELLSYYQGTYIWPAGTLNAGTAPNPGASGQSGFSPAVSGAWSRRVKAGYADFSQALTSRWTIDLAGRYEDYSEFGGVVAGKFATRYEFNEAFAIRGTVSNGFSAPTLQQEHYTTVGGGYTTDPTTGLLTQTFTTQTTTTSVIGRALGASALRPERSTNFSAGFVLKPLDRTTVTVDAYSIDISNRVIVTPTLQGATVKSLLAAVGITNVNQVTFFTNAARTQTRGIDLLATRFDDFGRFGRLKWTLASNENVTHVKELAGIPSVLANSGIAWSRAITSQLTQYYPQNISSLGLSWLMGNFDASITEKRFSSTNFESVSGPTLDQHVSPAFITNLDLGYTLLTHARVSVGATNLLNKRPDQQTASAIRLASVPLDAPAYTWYSPYGNDGGYYYVRARYSW